MSKEELIRFCVHSVSPRERDALKAAGHEPRDCLSRCTECFEAPCLVRGEDKLEAADTARVLRDAHGHPAASAAR